ncbi:MAG: hypothetical protein KC646_00560 [Candidatus Cloacimonetes bacterium]|nr:hypothetical protein [Candidatus Cloacimonadota bacterium]
MNLIKYLVAFALFTGLSNAQYISSGGYTFNVDAINSRHRVINRAQIRVYVSGTTATIEATADGYRRGRERVYLNSTQKNYRARVRMEDPTIWFRVEDSKGKQIRHHLDDSQFGSFDPSKYEFEVRLNEEGFDDFSDFDVDLKVNFSHPWNENIRVYGSGLNKRVKFVIDRRDLREYSNNIEVNLPRDQNLKKSRHQKVQKMNFKLIHSEEEIQSDMKTRILNRIQQFKATFNK